MITEQGAAQLAKALCDLGEWAATGVSAVQQFVQAWNGGPHGRSYAPRGNLRHSRRFWNQRRRR